MGPVMGFLTSEPVRVPVGLLLREWYPLESYHVMPSGTPLKEPTTWGDVIMSTVQDVTTHPCHLAASHKGAEPSGVGRGTLNPSLTFECPPLMLPRVQGYG